MASGRGSNFQALIDAAEKDKIQDADPVSYTHLTLPTSDLV